MIQVEKVAAFVLSAGLVVAAFLPSASSALDLVFSRRDVQATSAVSVIGIGEDSDGASDGGPSSGSWASRELQSISAVSDSLSSAGAGSSAQLDASNVSATSTSLSVSGESTVTSLTTIDDFLDAAGASTSGQSAIVVSFTSESTTAYLLSGNVFVNLFSDVRSPGTRDGVPFAGLELFEGFAGGGDPGGADTIAVLLRTDFAADGVSSSGSLNRSGTLPPGTYTIQAVATAEHSTGGGLVDTQMGASYSFGFSVQEVPEPSALASTWAAFVGISLCYFREHRSCLRGAPGGRSPKRDRR